MTLTTTPDPANAAKRRRLGRREEFREAFARCLELCDSLSTYTSGTGYRYEELHDDLCQTTDSTCPRLNASECELVAGISRLLAHDPASNEYRLRESLAALLECPDLNEEALDDVTLETVADAEALLQETKLP